MFNYCQLGRASHHNCWFHELQFVLVWHLLSGETGQLSLSFISWHTFQCHFWHESSWGLNRRSDRSKKQTRNDNLNSKKRNLERYHCATSKMRICELDEDSHAKIIALKPPIEETFKRNENEICKMKKIENQEPYQEPGTWPGIPGLNFWSNQEVIDYLNKFLVPTGNNARVKVIGLPGNIPGFQNKSSDHHHWIEKDLIYVCNYWNIKRSY